MENTNLSTRGLNCGEAPVDALHGGVQRGWFKELTLRLLVRSATRNELRCARKTDSNKSEDQIQKIPEKQATRDPGSDSEPRGS
jgi:hypothetical protein